MRAISSADDDPHFLLAAGADGDLRVGDMLPVRRDEMADRRGLLVCGQTGRQRQEDCDDGQRSYTRERARPTIRRRHVRYLAQFRLRFVDGNSLKRIPLEFATRIALQLRHVSAVPQVGAMPPPEQVTMPYRVYGMHDHASGRRIGATFIGFRQ